jgi:hypothetical protein
MALRLWWARKQEDRYGRFEKQQQIAYSTDLESRWRKISLSK